MNAECLLSARSTLGLVEAARIIVDETDFVTIDDDRLAALLPEVADAQPISWAWSLPSPDIGAEEAAFHFAFNAGLNGGYFAMGPDYSIHQWAIDGSGSRALEAWIAALRRDEMLPLIHLDTIEVLRRLPARLNEIPHAQARLDICADFAGTVRQHHLSALVSSCRTADGYAFSLKTVDQLARIYPAAFGADPFRKKACLAIIMLAGYLHSRGHVVACDVPIPSDYQIPRILLYVGALKPSVRLIELLTSDRLLSVTSWPVVSLRAAALVAAHDLAAMAGKPDGVIDGALFTTYRKDPDFKAKALPPMRCDSLWF